jgi:rhamnosyltransferase
MRFYSVIVTYHPDVVRVQQMVDVLSSVNVEVIVVDNTESHDDVLEFSNAELISLGHNSGIAHAQNAGIAHAMKNDAKAIVFFDQDSRIDESLIMQLTSAVDVSYPLVVAPVFFDEKNDFEYPAILVSRHGLRKKVYPSCWSQPADVDIVISSGTMANREALAIIGMMNEDFFIDYVDTEWCLRARDRGVPIRIIPTAIMMHSIGDNSLDLKYLKVPVHSPARRYYRVRNSFYLITLPHVPKLLAIREVLFAFVHQAVILCAVKGRRHYLTYFFKALKDAMQKKKGKISS